MGTVLDHLPGDCAALLFNRALSRVTTAVSGRNMRSLLQQLPGSLHEGKVDGAFLDLGISSMQVRHSTLPSPTAHPDMPA